MGAIGIGTPIYYHSTPIRPGAVVDKPEFVFEVLVSNAGDTIDLETVNGGSGFPNFKINWGEGPDQTSTSKTNNHTYANTGTYVIKINKSGTVTPVNNFSVLATNQGKAMVTKVTDWGDNEWFSLRQAFEDCVNLETLSTDTELKTAPVTAQIFTFTFRGCTSLQAADMTNWVVNSDTSSASYRWQMQETFKNCSSLALIRPPSSKVMPVSYFNSIFEGCGTAVVGGMVCELKGLDFSSSTTTSIAQLFKDSKIDGNNSDFSDWVFSDTITSAVNLFYFAQVLGTNPILDCSGWTTFKAANLQGMFRGLNNGADENNLTLNVSNLNLENVNSMYLFLGHNFSQNKIANIIGLSTWGATAGDVNFQYAFAHSSYLKLTASDNFSDAFINSLTPTASQYSFFNIGNLLSSGDFGEPPNLASLDLSNANNLVGIFFGSHFSSLPDFTNVTFPTAAVSWTNFLRDISTDSVTSHLDLSNKTFKPTSLVRAFEYFESANKITFPSGTNSDLSSLTTLERAFYGAGSATAELEVILPTDADYSAVTNWANAFVALDGPGTVNLTTCVVNTLIRRLKATALTGNGQLIDLSQSKYSGPQALVGNDLAELQTATPVYTFGTLSPEDPYFSIPNYISPSGTTQNITFATGVATDGTWTVTPSGLATIDNSTPASPTITAATNGNGVIRYTLTDGCYNEVNFTATIPLIANNFSFNFDGINDNLTMDPFDIPSPNSTLTMWFNSSDIGGPTGGNRVLTVLFSKQSQYFPYIDESAAGKIQMFVKDDAGTTATTSSVDFNANEWYHLAITQSSTGLFFYINGQKMNSTAGVSRYPTALTRISGYPNNTYNLLGKIDEMAVWNTTLTDAQILDIYNGRLGVTNETVDLSGYDGLGGNLVYWNRMGD